MKCSGVALLVADLVTQLPKLVNLAMGVALTLRDASITPISLPQIPLAATSTNGGRAAVSTFFGKQIVFYCTRRGDVRSTAPYALSGAAHRKHLPKMFWA